ncbi:unnamed protein product [Brassica oleracea]
MGTELMRVCMKEESDELPSVPPGFESYASFTLKRPLPDPGAAADKTKTPMESSVTEQANKMEEIESDELKAARSLRRRPWINYAGCDDDDTAPNNDNASPQNLDQVSSFFLFLMQLQQLVCLFSHSLRPLQKKPSLPKGVTRGCAECNDCQKVTARWHPDEARRPDLEDAPIFYPTEEEFEDTLSYIAKIRPKAEKYGICRIVPPPSWKPPCPLKEKQVWEGSKFTTRVQRVDKLQNRSSMKKILSNQMRRKKRKCMKTGVDAVTNGNASTQTSGFETFGFEPGPGFSLNDFKKYADEFKAQYFKKSETFCDKECRVGNSWEPGVEDVEGEYWRIVDKATEEIEVLYGADLETGVFGSGFPKLSSSSSDEKYAKSGWNLNNFSRLPGSLLKHEGSDISGVLVPWLYIGMCFSSFCWHVEDHHLYSLNYMHWGAPKLWYGVAGKDAVKLEDAMRKHLPDLFEEQPDLLHKLAKKYTCLTHVRQLCSCPLVSKYFLFRYDIDELNVLVEAVEGKLSAVYRWARQDLGLALSAHVSERKMEMDEEGKVHKDLSPQADVSLLLKDNEERSTPSQCMKPVKEETVNESSVLKDSVCQPPEGGMVSVAAAKPTSGKKNSRGSVSSSKHLRIIRERPTHVLALEAIGKTPAPNFEKQVTSLPDTRNTISSLPTNDQRAVREDVPSSVPHGEVNAVADDICNRVDISNQPTSSKSKISGGLAILDVVDGTRSKSSTPSNGTRSNSGTPTCSQNNSPDRIIRQKGPRIAKVVRRVKCKVEPLSYGCVLSGKSWCNRQAIFPKGFRSRVRYINILDPTNMSFYVSEILDAGRNSPLFMVYLEANPSEVFAHLSPTRCWEMVRERVNQEISKQHKAGRLDLPPLQPSGSPDGFEMFGYTSPAIIQAIEALDVNRVCTEYWDSRPYSRPQVQFPANPLPREANTSILLPAGTNSTLKVLLKKANMEELSSLQQVLSESNIDLVTELVKEELQNRR